MTRLQLQRCVAGRLRNAYPVAEHDVEVTGFEGTSPTALVPMLHAAVAEAFESNPRCRRVLVALRLNDGAALAAATAAGFRKAVDVDLADAELTLMLVESESTRPAARI